MSWTDLRDAIQGAVASAAGLAGDKVIWKYQNANQPPLAYIALTVSPASNPGQDGIQATFVGGPDPLVDMRLDVIGLREITLSLEVFTDSVADDNDSLALAERIRSAFRLPSIMAKLSAQGVSPLEVGPAQFLPAIVAVKFRARSTLDVRCLAPAQPASDLIGYFNKVTGSATIAGGAGGPTTTPYSAP